MIDAGGDRDPLRQWHEGNCAGAQIARVRRPQRKKVAVLVDRELGFRHQVAAVEISQERVTAVAEPFDRAAYPLCRPGHQDKFRAGVVADAKIAADIAGDDAHRLFWHAQRAGDIVALPNDASAGAGVDGELSGSGVIRAERGAQFHRHAGDAVDRCFQLARRKRPARTPRRSSSLSPASESTHRFEPCCSQTSGAPGASASCRAGHAGKRFVAHLHPLGGIHRLRQCFRNDDRDRVADIAHGVDGKDRVRRDKEG